MHAPERAEVVANVPAVALEPELVVRNRKIRASNEL